MFELILFMFRMIIFHLVRAFLFFLEHGVCVRERGLLISSLTNGVVCVLIGSIYIG